MPVSNTIKNAETTVNRYLFAGQNKTVGQYILTGEKLPQGARVKRAWYEVTTPFTSALNLATISLGIDVDAPAGLLGSTLVSSGLLNSIGSKDTLITGLATLFTSKTTSARDVIANVAAQTLTAGNLTLFIEYYIV